MFVCTLKRVVCTHARDKCGLRLHCIKNKVNNGNFIFNPEASALKMHIQVMI